MRLTPGSDRAGNSLKCRGRWWKSLNINRLVISNIPGISKHVWFLFYLLLLIRAHICFLFLFRFKKKLYQTASADFGTALLNEFPFRQVTCHELFALQHWSQSTWNSYDHFHMKTRAGSKLAFPQQLLSFIQKYTYTLRWSLLIGLCI